MSPAETTCDAPPLPDLGPLLVDDRERSAVLWQALVDEGFAVESVRLPAGDLLLSGRWRVERKTGPDFRASLLDGRLFRQAARLRRFPEAPLFLLEGQADATPLLPGELGALLCLILDLDLPVVPSTSPADTARLLGLLARRQRRHATGVRKPGATPRCPVSVRLLASLPGIGDMRARALLQTFPHLAAVTAATTEELETVPGIGPALARRLEKAFHERTDPTATRTLVR